VTRPVEALDNRDGRTLQNIESFARMSGSRDARRDTRGRSAGADFTELRDDCCVASSSTRRAPRRRHERTWMKITSFADLERELPHRLEKRQALDVAGRAADLRDKNVGAFCRPRRCDP